MGITIIDLVKSYEQKEVLHVDRLELEETGIVGLVGNNGAGKTTLLRLILDLVQADKGEVRSNGILVTASEEWKRYTGAYLDEGFLVDYLTPREFFQLVAAIRGLPDDAILCVLERFATLFEEGFPDRSPLIRRLSKGIVQKVGIAAAFLGDPQVVVLDEPFAHLDPSAQLSLKGILHAYALESGALILLSSHSLHHVLDLCSRVVLLDHGRIVRDDTVGTNGSLLLRELEHYFSVRSRTN